MTGVMFTVRFHEPFLVGSGQSGGGLDATARRRALPAESLKGAMRAGACVLGVQPETISEVYGKAGEVAGSIGQGGWCWGDAGPEWAFQRHSRSRNRIAAPHGNAHPEALAFTEEIWQLPDATVTFAVEPLRPLNPDLTTVHTAVLMASAYAVTALGQWRNRGMGTVTIRPVDPIDPTLIQAQLKAPGGT